MKIIKKLYLKQIDRDFDFRSDEVIGAWCFQGAEDIYVDWYKINFIEPFSDTEFYKNSSLKAKEITDFFITKYAKKFNQLHKVSYPESFWAHIMNGWLGLLVLAVYARYVHIKVFLERNEKKKYEVEVIVKSGKFNFQDPHEFSKALNDHEFDFWISSLIFLYLKPSNVKLLYKYDTAKKIKTNNAGVNSVDKSSRFSSVYNIPIWWAKIFSFMMNFVVNGNKRYSSVQYFKIDKPESQSYEIFDLMDIFISSTVPRTFTDLFTYYNSVALTIQYKPNKIRISNTDSHDILLSFINAHAYLCGEKVAYVQHGSFYGLTACYNQFISSDYSKDYFLTWGWKIHHGFLGNFLPIKMPHYKSKTIMKIKNQENLLYVDNVTNALKFTLAGYTPPGMLGAERIKKSCFFYNLISSIREKVIFRPHVYHAGFNDSKFLKNNGLVNRFLLGSSDEFKKFFDNAKLVVLPSYTTTFHVALGANIPTVCYWDNFPILTKQAHVAFDKLRSVGIIHTNVECAAEFINQRWDFLEKWWFSSNVQEARKEWCLLNFNTSRFWYLSWIKFIMNYP